MTTQEFSNVLSDVLLWIGVVLMIAAVVVADELLGIGFCLMIASVVVRIALWEV